MLVVVELDVREEIGTGGTAVAFWYEVASSITPGVLVVIT